MKREREKLDELKLKRKGRRITRRNSNGIGFEGFKRGNLNATGRRSAIGGLSKKLITQGGGGKDR